MRKTGRATEYGRRAEQAAAEHLAAHGYVIRDRNWSPSGGHVELDIVAQQGRTLVFVEVKARADGYVDPVYAVNAAKIARVCRAANAYVQALPPGERDVLEPRFDVIAIVGDAPHWQIEHLEDAFIPPVSPAYRRGPGKGL